MKTNDLKKGDRVQLRNGWYATIEDNLKGNTRMATVEGIYTEMGSVYSHDIDWYLPGFQRPNIPLEYTPHQLKLKEQVEAF